ncbi:aquaporin rerated protein [Apiospora hydei]|uniref:Aquaporin rerated protein n=1 Tax=Apiospora hydei TaxID=1337664 RepID=A0ABR1WQM6_9PEZI
MRSKRLPRQNRYIYLAPIQTATINITTPQSPRDIVNNNMSSYLPSSHGGHKRLPERPEPSLVQRMVNRAPWKQHFVATLGEFVGTFQFLFFGNATHLMIIDLAAQSPTPKLLQVVFIGYGYGFSLLVNAWAFYRISGGLFNPAITLGLCLAGKLPWIRLFFYVPAQLAGGVLAGALCQALFPGDFSGTITKIAPGMTVVRGLFGEVFLTAFLMFTILMLAGEKSRTSFVAPVGIGLTLFVGQLAGVFFTGGSLNPARSLGSSAAAAQFPSYHWIYWAGPGLGAIVAAIFFRILKALDYEEANPGQDAKCEV